MAKSFNRWLSAFSLVLAVLLAACSIAGASIPPDAVNAAPAAGAESRADKPLNHSQLMFGYYGRALVE